MLRIILFLLSLFYSIEIWAQPGGGGGLQIGEIQDENGFGITYSDTSYKFELWVIQGYGPNAALAGAWPDYPGRSRWTNHDGIISLSLPPENIRLRISHFTDTMMIDFHDMMQENAAGITSFCESIQFMRGFWTWGLTETNRSIEGNHILNKSNAPILLSAGVLKYSNVLPTGWESPKRWSRLFLLQTAINKIIYFNRPAEAFYYLDLANERYQTKAEKNEVEYFRAVALDSLDRDEEAIELLLSMDWKSLDPFMQYQLIRLFTEQGRYQEGLEVYDQLCSPTQRHYCIDKANYIAVYLSDFYTSKGVLDQMISEIPEDNMRNRSIGSNEYSSIYVAKGNICLRFGSVKEAIQSYLKSVEFYPSGIDINLLKDSVIHLAVSLPNDPAVAKLQFITLLRAHQMNMTSVEIQIQLKPQVEMALEQWRLNRKSGDEFDFWEGQWHYQLKDYAKAEAAFSRAIRLNSDDPRYYMHRYLAKVHLSGQLGKTAEEDRLKSIELAKTWKYTR